MEILLLLGRVFFSIIFIISGTSHITRREAMVGYARMMNVPVPSLLVPLTGLMIILGGISIALGFYAQIGAGLIIIFLMPTTVMMHRFWGLQDEQMAQTQKAMFLKNLSMLGAASIILFLYSALDSVPLSIN